MSSEGAAPVDPKTQVSGDAAVRVLTDRVSELEDALGEILEVLEKMRRQMSRLEEKVATRKQIKKLKKVLDQLEVIEVGPDDSAPPENQSGNV